ncbi:MAG TPA: alpha/beta hydrolase [Pseudonocardiaceae bacterium]|nr:alpha/beta hydrolase [Pseudonocardiaceae bacterium]
MIGLVVVLAAGVLAGGWGLQRRLIYFPEPSVVPPVASVLPGAREVRLHTADGLELGAWLMPASGRDRNVTVLVASGNAGNRSLRAPLAAMLSRAGMAVLLFDYRGYGGNSGTPSEAGLALDVRAAHQYLIEDHGVRQDRLLYFGESLGAAVVTELATEHPPAGLLLRSPFVELAAVGRAHYPYLPVDALLRDRYPLAEQLARITVPTTVVYGTEDGIVPPDQSRAVATHAGGPTALVAVHGADHNDRALLDGGVLLRAVIELADRATADRP